MDSFLHEVAERLHKTHGNNLSQVCVVFNNRRSGLFLRKHLAQIGPESFFLPKTMGMDDIVHEICGLEIIPKELLLFELYDIHRTIATKDELHPFEHFLPLGEMMLNDFSEIDLYQADVDQLFGNLYEAKMIESWDVSGAPLTPFQQNYLKFYHSLFQYYTELRRRLSAEGRSYAGMAYRMAAEQVEKHPFGYQHIYFVGFNAISKAEQQIVRCLVRRGEATLVCDGDAYYYDDTEQEAGRFLRSLKKDFESIGDYDDHFAMEPKHITLVNSPEDLMQVKYAGDLLHQLTTTGGGNTLLEDTAVVLADEGLLVPMLNSLPDTVDAINVTMGYPLVHTAIHELTLKLTAWCKNMRSQGAHHIALTDLVTNPCMEAIGGWKLKRSRLQKTLYDQQIRFIDREKLQALGTTLGTDFAPIYPLYGLAFEDPEGIIAQCRQWGLKLLNDTPYGKNKKESVAIESYLQLMDQFDEIQRRYRVIDSVDTLERIYARMAQRVSVPFYGEPLHGLQILGMLETRNLDFQRVILVSANEGVLPAGRKENSLIPYSLKRSGAFSIPTHEEKDAVYANHFYRLLQRANEIYIIYSSQADSMGKGEPSRFVLQLIGELIPKYPNIKLQETVIGPQISGNSFKENLNASIEKSPFVLERLTTMGNEIGFSPSAMSIYLKCAMKYYFRYLLRIKEPDEVGDSMDESMFGTLVHAILQDLYTPLVGTEPNADTLRALLSEVASHIESVFSKMGAELVRKGRTQLQKRIAIEQVKHLILSDIQTVSSGHTLRIVALEKELEKEIETPYGIVKAKGKADRIDLVDGMLRIVDYKTGKVDKKDLDAKKSITDFEHITSKALQVLMYAWMYVCGNDKKPIDTGSEFILSGIYPLSNLSQDYLPLNIFGSEKIDRNMLETFGQALSDRIAGLLNPEEPFLVAQKESTCKLGKWDCYYKSICGRYFSERTIQN